MNDSPQRLMAFDFGMKRMGVAIGQVITHSATPLETLPMKDGVPAWENISRLIQRWKPDALIVGIPLNMDGTDQPITHTAREFAIQLAEKTNLPVHPMDERLTTKAAREQLFLDGGYKALQSGQVDAYAAKLILENWFALHP